MEHPHGLEPEFYSEIDEENIEFKDFPEELSCPIHLGFLKNPVVSKCGHSFCRDCIRKVLANKSQCPIDRKPLHLDDLNPNLLVSNIIDELYMYCKYSSRPSLRGSDGEFENKGCPELVKFKDRNVHLKRCLFVPAKCPYCFEHMLRKELVHHLLECQRRPEICKMCEKSLSFCHMEKHLRDFCQKAEIPCSKCHKSFKRGSMKSHMESECEEMEVSCLIYDKDENEYCLTRCPRKSIAEHRATCIFRAVSCPNEGCLCTFPDRRSDQHQKICKNRVVICPNGCEKTFARWRESSHLANCPLELIECDFAFSGCKTKKPRREMPTHMTDYAIEHTANLGPHLKDLVESNVKLTSSNKTLQDRVVELEKKLRLVDQMLHDALGTEPIFKEERKAPEEVKLEPKLYFVQKKAEPQVRKRKPSNDLRAEVDEWEEENENFYADMAEMLKEEEDERRSIY